MFKSVIALVLLINSIEYTVQTTGPRTVVEGTVRLHFNEDQQTDCLQHTFELIKGRLGGPVTSSQPGQPMLAFDTVVHVDNQVSIEWCRTISDLQNLPCESPRHFNFYVIKNTYTAQDLTKLLAEWGNTDSVWDLNLDGAVDGLDLTYVLGNWVNE